MNKSVIMLSTIGSPLLPLMIEAFENSQWTIRAVIMDSELSQRDMHIIKSRLDPCFSIKNLKDIHSTRTPFYFVRNHQDQDTINLIKEIDANIIVNAGTPRILKGDILRIKPGILNCHPGILPKYRGCTTLEWSIFNNDPVGATVHFMTEGIDEGPIVLSETMEIPLMQSYEVVRTRMLLFTALLMAKGASICHEKGLTYESANKQIDGSYFKPIPYEKLIEVRQKLLNGTYTTKLITE